MPEDPVKRTLATYETVAEEYRDRHADRSVVAHLVDRFDASLAPGSRVLDVGCGPGWESATLLERGHDVTAIDLSASFLRAAGEVAPDAARSRMDMRELAVADGRFDGVWALASFLHVPREDAPSTLREFARVLDEGGVLFCGVKRGSGECLGRAYDGDDRRFTLYEPEEFRGLVERAGFDVSSLQSEDGWLQVLARV
ncbi:class I SAM-dependent methyltransferase [Halomarina litorea]|uniref:class I SAM-dependent methyltransferase n=1 Tax=Halomarina litorea TaxID=2961595 RepID=UPI0020C45AF4|nr:class I SAM-dependent methyltransferase [Halomarina sp. BCD28]